MNGLPYYKAYPRDFIEGTVVMPFELKGTYRIVLDLIYMHGGKLPDNTKYICGVLGCHHHRWHRLRSQLIELGKVVIDGEWITNSRVTLEIEKTATTVVTPRVTPRVTPGPTPHSKRHPTEQNQSLKPPYTDTDTDTERGEAKASLVRSSRFPEFWEAYPHRNGRRNRKGTEAKYATIVRRGVSEQILIDGAKSAHRDRRVMDGYARDPTTWLNQEGWADEFSETVTQFPRRQNDGDRLDQGLEALKARLAFQRLE